MQNVNVFVLTCTVTVGYPTAKTIQTAPRVQQMQHQQHQRVVVPQDGSNKQVKCAVAANISGMQRWCLRNLSTQSTNSQSHRRKNHEVPLLCKFVVNVIGVRLFSQSASRKKYPQTFAHLMNFSKKFVCHVWQSYVLVTMEY